MKNVLDSEQSQRERYTAFSKVLETVDELLINALFSHSLLLRLVCPSPPPKSQIQQVLSPYLDDHYLPQPSFKRNVKALSLGAHHPPTQESRVPPQDEAEWVGQQLLKVYGPACQHLTSKGITLGLLERQILIQKF